MLFVAVRVLLLSWLGFAGCATLESKEFEGEAKSESVVVGFIQVETKGPYFRMHQKEALVRFFDVRNNKTGERTRIHIEPEAEMFVTKLSQGEYKLFRIQIGEGPFRSESHVNMGFDVPEGEKPVYLGTWKLRVDPPKTVRMLQLDILSGDSNRDLFVGLSPDLSDKPVIISLPQPVTTQVRLFAVAPSQPRAKYFYRR